MTGAKRSISRGLSLLHLFLLLAGLAGTVAPAAGPPNGSRQASPPPLTVQAVTKNLYLVKGGSGANTAFFITKEAVFVIDAKMTSESAEMMLNEIRKAATVPVTTIILTHSDGDHINGLPGFPKGLAIIAHENCKADITAAAEAMPELKDYIPTRSYSQQRLTLHEDDAPVELVYFGPAHTNGDTVVFFPGEKAVFVGDLLFVGRDPLIHRHKSGNSFGYVKTLQAILDLSPPVEIFLSGHADPLTRNDVESLKTSMSEKQAKVKDMIAAGKRLEDIKKAFGIEDRPGQPGGRRWLSLVETIYLELTEK